LGNVFDAQSLLPPNYLRNGSVILPLGDALRDGLIPDADVHWDPTSGAAALTRRNQEIILSPGLQTADAGIRQISLPVAPFREGNRLWVTIVPLVTELGGVAYLGADQENLVIHWATRSAVDEEVLARLRKQGFGNKIYFRGGHAFLGGQLDSVSLVPAHTTPRNDPWIGPYADNYLRMQLRFSPAVPRTRVTYREFPYRVEIAFGQKAVTAEPERLALPKWAQPLISRVLSKLRLDPDTSTTMILLDGPALIKADDLGSLTVDLAPDTSVVVPERVYAVRLALHPRGETFSGSERERLVKAGCTREWLYVLPTEDEKSEVFEAGAFPSLREAEDRAAALRAKGVEVTIVSRPPTALPSQNDSPASDTPDRPQ